MKLSFVLPFYKRLGLFRLTLPHNLPVFTQPETEVVVACDEPESEQGLLEIAKEFPQIKWRIIVNDNDHAWHPPCKAINVGIRNSEGESVAILSPESVIQCEPKNFLTHRISNRSSEPIYVTGIVVSRDAWVGIPNPSEFHKELYQTAGFGFLAAARSAFEKICGFDEFRTKHGKDDECIRWKLQRFGIIGIVDYGIRIVHFNHDIGEGIRQPLQACEPSMCRSQEDWGNSFKRIALDWRNR